MVDNMLFCPAVEGVNVSIYLNGSVDRNRYVCVLHDYIFFGVLNLLSNS